MTLHLTQREGTAAIARILAGQVRAGDVILLSGDVGAGKTTFAQYFIHGLAGDGVEVTSPTFTLRHDYALPTGTALVHMDMYRIAHESELAELGLDDVYDTAISLIEWPERMGSQLPKEFLCLRFEIAQDDHRNVTCVASPAWQARVKEFEHACIREAGAYVTAG